MPEPNEILNQTLDSDDEKILGVSISIADIREKIATLSQTADGEPLRGAMNDLQIALKSNPEACALLQPEEIGEMVKHLYKITNTVVVEEKKKKATRESKKVDLNDPTIYDKLPDF
jgi:SUMO ligase MMS21 Smc5/6 complex component